MKKCGCRKYDTTADGRETGRPRCVFQDGCECPYADEDVGGCEIAAGLGVVEDADGE